MASITIERRDRSWARWCPQSRWNTQMRLDIQRHPDTVHAPARFITQPRPWTTHCAPPQWYIATSRVSSHVQSWPMLTRPVYSLQPRLITFPLSTGPLHNALPIYHCVGSRTTAVRAGRARPHGKTTEVTILPQRMQVTKILHSLLAQLGVSCLKNYQRSC